VISRERGKDREVFTTSGTYPGSFVTHVFYSGQPSHGGEFPAFGSTLLPCFLYEVHVLLFFCIYLRSGIQHDLCIPCRSCRLSATNAAGTAYPSGASPVFCVVQS